MLISRRSWTNPGASGGGGWISYIHGHRNAVPRGAERACPCGSCGPRPESRASLLTLANRVNVTGIGFGPDVTFSVESAAKRTVTSSGVTAGIRFVLNS